MRRCLAHASRSILFCHQLLLSLVKAAQLNVTDAQDGRRACSATLCKHSFHCNNNGANVSFRIIHLPSTGLKKGQVGFHRNAPGTLEVAPRALFLPPSAEYVQELQAWNPGRSFQGAGEESTARICCSTCIILQNQLLSGTTDGWYVGEGEVNANTALLRPV